MTIKPKTITQDGVTFVSVPDLVHQIDVSVPKVAIHGIFNNDPSFSLGMVEGLLAVKKVITTS